MVANYNGWLLDGSPTPATRSCVSTAGWLGSICRDFGLNVREESDRQIAPSTATIAHGCLLGAGCRWWPMQWLVVLRQSDPSHPDRSKGSSTPVEGGATAQRMHADRATRRSRKRNSLANQWIPR